VITTRRPELVASEVERAVRGGARRVELLSLDGGGPIDLERLGAARYGAGRDAELRLVLDGATPAVSLESALREFRARLRRPRRARAAR
jgi:hypothetical protein